MLISSMAKSSDTYAGFSAGYTTFGRLLHSDCVKILIKLIDSPVGETELSECIFTLAALDLDSSRKVAHSLISLHFLLGFRCPKRTIYMIKCGKTS